MTEAGRLARQMDPQEAGSLLDVALSVEDDRVRSLEGLLPETKKLADHVTLLRAVREHLGPSSSPIGASETRGDAERPKRCVDGPLVYAFTEKLTEEEGEFFKEKLSANHRAMIEALLELCDGEHTPTEIAFQLSLDVGRIVPVEDVVQGIRILRKVEYVAR